MARSSRRSASARVSGKAQPWRVKRWQREPLLRCLVAGLALCAVYSELRPDLGQHVERSQIEGTRGRPPPTPCHLDGAVENANIPHFTT